MTSTFEGAEINGKQFPFIRLTVANEPKIIKRFLPTKFSRILERYFPLKSDMRTWHKVRAIAFQKGWKWKYLRIIPKELRDSEITIGAAGGIQVDFFSYVATKRQEYKQLFVSANSLLTKTESIKPED